MATPEPQPQQELTDIAADPDNPHETAQVLATLPDLLSTDEGADIDFEPDRLRLTGGRLDSVD